MVISDGVIAERNQIILDILEEIKRDIVSANENISARQKQVRQDLVDALDSIDRLVRWVKKSDS